MIDLTAWQEAHGIQPVWRALFAPQWYAAVSISDFLADAPHLQPRSPRRTLTDVLNKGNPYILFPNPLQFERTGQKVGLLSDSTGIVPANISILNELADLEQGRAEMVYNAHCGYDCATRQLTLRWNEPTGPKSAQRAPFGMAAYNLR